MSAVRCGRLDDHEAHEWTRPRSIVEPAQSHVCAGQVITAYAEQLWAEQADAAEQKADEFREWMRGAW